MQSSRPLLLRSGLSLHLPPSCRLGWRVGEPRMGARRGVSLAASPWVSPRCGKRTEMVMGPEAFRAGCFPSCAPARAHEAVLSVLGAVPVARCPPSRTWRCCRTSCESPPRSWRSTRPCSSARRRQPRSWCWSIRRGWRRARSGCDGSRRTRTSR